MRIALVVEGVASLGGGGTDEVDQRHRQDASGTPDRPTQPVVPAQSHVSERAPIEQADGQEHDRATKSPQKEMTVRGNPIVHHVQRDEQANDQQYRP